MYSKRVTQVIPSSCCSSIERHARGGARWHSLQERCTASWRMNKVAGAEMQTCSAAKGAGGCSVCVQQLLNTVAAQQTSGRTEGMKVQTLHCVI